MKHRSPCLLSSLLILTFSASAALTQEMSTLCQFEKGPRAGAIRDYAPMAPLPVGRPCHDGQGSSGSVVAPMGSSAKISGDVAGFLTSSCAKDAPGGAIIAVRNGETVLRHACGLADLEHGIQLEPDMVFRLGSVTKQFTAVAVLMLEREGKLQVPDEITMHLPDYPTQGKTITVEHLLTHTSGIPNYTALPGWIEAKAHLDLSVKEMLAEWQDLPLEFDPGSRFAYSNSGYFMLGAIIEAVSGVDYATFVEKRIFEPLAMTSSYFGSHSRVIPNRVNGYQATDNGDGYLNAPFIDMDIPHAAGSLLSTVDDLAKWDAALYTDQLLPAAARSRMWTSYILPNSEKAGYGYGWGIGEVKGRKMVHHGGGIFGFSTMVMRVPEERLYVAVLTNGGPIDPGAVARQTVLALLEEPAESP
ncbi:MAG: beta-lactamase family protein [Deltaproteobacteria bacterium]|nr:beta-lactamase family protein [Deltaproteobacteria bacterium]